MKIAVIGDTHLPYLDGTFQYESLAWAVSRINAANADFVVIAGDVTADGSIVAAERFLNCIKTLNSTVVCIPGNSDMRGNDSGKIRQLLSFNCSVSTEKLLILTLYVQNGVILNKDCLKDLGGKKREIALFMHYSIDSLERENRLWLLKKLAENRQISLLVSGHVHSDSFKIVDSTQIHTFRGLDPDKAIGGPPSIAYFTLGDKWERSDEQMPDFKDKWSLDKRKSFIDNLGLSLIDAEQGLDFACENNVKNIELRGSLSAPNLQLSLSKWRQLQNTCLSVHLPALIWDDNSAGFKNADNVKEEIKKALSFNAQLLTVHVPSVPVGYMQYKGNRQRVLAAYCSCFKDVPASVKINIENLHMTAGEKDDDARMFGYLPEECLQWLHDVKGHSKNGNFGLILDIGHARNNMPFSEKYTLSVWYKLVGEYINAFHVHQVKVIEGHFKNHCGFDEMFGHVISLYSFLWAWEEKIINNSPIFLEIRDLQQCIDSFKMIKSYMALN